MMGNSGSSMSMEFGVLAVVIAGVVTIFGFLVFRGPKDQKTTEDENK
jgi:hypothetical protein